MKQKLIFGTLAVLMVFSIFSISRGADKFYYGSWGGNPERDFPFIKDSLRFNIVNTDVHSSTVDSFVNHSLRAMVGNYGCGSTDEYSPYRQAGQSHYTLWEAEGWDGSYFNLSYNGGEVVNDPYASGGKAVKFTGPGTPRLIQWGPTYSQERGDPANPIKYTAEFRLKLFYSLYQPRGGRLPTPGQEFVCCIMVVDTVSDSILKADTLCKGEFPSDGSYKIFTLADYTVPVWNQIEFQIYWFALPVAIDFRIDYVKVYDQNGWDLIENPTHYVANQIKAYVDSPWVHTTLPDGDTVVYRWYMRDQPEYIDCYKPFAYIDSLLKLNLPHIPGAQFTCHYSDTIRIHEYLLRSHPEEYMVDAYVFHADDTTESNIQQSLNLLTDNYNYNKRTADSLDKDFWVAVRAHLYAELKKMILIK
jgi:hypothetical protein